MRRYAAIICLLAGLNLVAAPFAKPHAHVFGDHGDVFVHGGHDHDVDASAFDAHDHPHARDHHAAQLIDDHHHSQAAAVVGAQLTAHVEVLGLSHAHVVSMETVADRTSLQPIKTFAISAVEKPIDLSIAFTVEKIPILRDTEFIRRAYLRPPLRGPPALHSRFA